MGQDIETGYAEACDGCGERFGYVHPSAHRPGFCTDCAIFMDMEDEGWEEQRSDAIEWRKGLTREQFQRVCESREAGTLTFGERCRVDALDQTEGYRW